MADTKISALTASTTPLTGTEVLPIVQSGVTKQVSVANLTAGRDTTLANLVAYNPGFSYFGIRHSSLAAAFANNALAQSADGLNTIVNAKAGGTVKLRINDASVLEVATDTTLVSGNLVQGTAGKGIDFSANTPAAGMTSELLNWYEEGTFTPTIVGTTTAGTGTYSLQTGTYTRTGRVVRFNVAITWSAHTGTGNMDIAGLPFTASATANSQPVSVASSNLTVPVTSTPVAMVSANTTTVRMYVTPTAGTDASISFLALDTAATLWVAGTYIV